MPSTSCFLKNDANPNLMMYPVLSLPHVNGIIVSVRTHSMNSSAIPSCKFNQWFTAFFRHHRASTCTVGVMSMVTWRSDVVAGAVMLACTVVLVCSGGGGADKQKLRVVELTRIN